jgi:hypothetical protein
MFPTDVPIFSLALWDDRSSDRHASVLDIVPSRWTPRIGFTDAVLTLVADFFSPSRGMGEWFDKSNQAVMLYNGFTHPDVDVEPGGAVLHTGTPVDTHFTLRAQARRLHLPDGTSFPTEAFANACTYTTRQAYRHINATESFLKGADTEMGKAAKSAVLGVFQALILAQHPYAFYKNTEGHVFDIVQVVADTLARALLCVPGSGQAASQKLKEAMEGFVSTLVHTWIVRPDRGWAASRWVPSPDWSTYLQAADAVVLDAAQAATNVLLNAHARANAILSPKDVEGSAHLRLAAMGERRALDNATLLALAPALGKLKPQAAAKARALASS